MPPMQLPPFGVFMTWHERYTRDPGHAWIRELSSRVTAEVLQGKGALSR